MTDQTKTKRQPSPSPAKRAAVFVDPRGKTDEEVTAELIAFLDKAAPLPTEDKPKTTK